MSLLEKVRLAVEHGDRVERAVDPETHEEFPVDRPTVGIKLLAWFAKTPWLRRQALKWITAGGAVLSAWLIANGGADHEAAIVAGAVAAFTFLYEQFISFLCNKAGIKAPAIDDEPEESPPARSLSAASPFAPVGGFPRPSFFTQTTTQPMSIHDERVIPDREPLPPQPRRIQQPGEAYSPFTTQSRQNPPPLGPKGCSVIAEAKAGDAASVSEVVRGTLRTEADGGTLIILATDSGVRTLERSEWNFYVRAE